MSSGITCLIICYPFDFYHFNNIFDNENNIHAVIFDNIYNYYTFLLRVITFFIFEVLYPFQHCVYFFTKFTIQVYAMVFFNIKKIFVREFSRI